uniref:RNA polymerase beta subunit b n=1 Tax=Coelastrella saipanensis TaxID=152631 RepID=UPI0010C414B3|nr:RNA polymerase beta subunit b [Coelastrella saipanensis]AVV61543.1 RNA polymerase beta subunit b [Coelastrella saipanensis]
MKTSFLMKNLFRKRFMKIKYDVFQKSFKKVEKFKIHRFSSFSTFLNFQKIPKTFSLEKAAAIDNSAAVQKTSKYSLQKYQRSNQDTLLVQRPTVREGDWVQSGDLLADCASSLGGELCLGKNIFIAYMPWKGYNYEDAILISERLVSEDVYTSVHIESYEVETRKTKLGKEQITNQIPDISEKEIEHLDTRGIVKLGTSITEGQILVGKVTPIQKKYKSPYEKLLYAILEKKLMPMRDSSLRTPKGLKAKVIEIKILSFSVFKSHKSGNSSKVFKTIRKPERVQVYLAEKRKIQVGDKMAGRHGNKGIVSKILPIQDMPFLPDGTPLDMILNPLGVPSRMNVGQIYECLLGLAAKYLKQYYRILPFDEMYGPHASRSFTFSKLYEARLKTSQKWLFNPCYPGKMLIFDGATGEPYKNPVTVGVAYMLKLVHLVDDKIHVRSTGPYSLVTQQPLRGRSKFGGQRLGEMEVWAIEAYGAAFILLEMLTIKSDDISGRMTLWSNIIGNMPIYIGTPESFKVLICELQALCMDIGLFQLNKKGFLTQIEHLMQLP